MNNFFCEVDNQELMQIEGGGFWAAVWTGTKVVAAVAGTGIVGLAVGAAAVTLVYNGCKLIFD